MKLAFRLAGILAAILFMIAAFSGAREWFILHHFKGYQPLDFVIGAGRREVNDETEFLLIGTCGAEKIQFHVSSDQYETYSGQGFVGTTLRIWKNDMMPEIADISFQQKSLKIILDDDWRSYDELRHSASSVTIMAGIFLGLSILLLLLGRRRPPESCSTGEIDF